MTLTIIDKKKLYKLCDKDKGLTKNQREYINKTLTKQHLFMFLNDRYAPDPLRYLRMTKKEMIEELKYDRYE